MFNVMKKRLVASGLKGLFKYKKIDGTAWITLKVKASVCPPPSP